MDPPPMQDVLEAELEDLLRCARRLDTHRPRLTPRTQLSPTKRTPATLRQAFRLILHT